MQESSTRNTAMRATTVVCITCAVLATTFALLASQATRDQHGPAHRLTIADVCWVQARGEVAAEVQAIRAKDNLIIRTLRPFLWPSMANGVAQMREAAFHGCIYDHLVRHPALNNVAVTIGPTTH